MLLKDVRLHPRTIMRYAERFINDGSPSGFSELNSTSPATSPFGFKPYFTLLSARSTNVRTFGSLTDAPFVMDRLPSDSIYVHPDMEKVLRDQGTDCDLRRTNMLVAPTASGRTVQILSGNSNDYLKLHYARVLGRMTRELSFAKAISGPETSRLIEAAVQKKELPAALHLLPEPFARVVSFETPTGDKEWGMVYRRSDPIGPEAEKIRILLPCFSLFSADRFAVHHPTLLSQVLSEVGGDADEYFVETIVTPVIDAYFMLLRILGLQAEWNAQNLLFGFSADFRCAFVVMRDLESVDKDISLMERVGVSTDFDSAPYKCIDASQYNYQIKHSFMFDFKLGECVLRPLFGAASCQLKMGFDTFASVVRTRVVKHLGYLPPNFFPDGRWYSFDKVLVDQRSDARPYLEHRSPVFRQ